MDDAKFLLARIGPRAATTGPLDWVAAERRPYRSIDPLDLDEPTLDAVFDMYSTEYSKIESKLNIPDRDGLFEYNRWILIEDPNGELLGFALLKTTPFGLKTGLTATDGSKEAKQAIKQFHRRVYAVDGVYAEVSDALENVVKDHVPHVKADQAEVVLHPKRITKKPDGYHDERHISNIGRRTKLMIGKPRLPTM